MVNFRYNSILPSFLCHMLNNAVALFLETLGSGGQSDTLSISEIADEIAAVQPWLLWLLFGSAFFSLGALYLFYLICKRLRRQSGKETSFVLSPGERRSIILHWPVVLIIVFFVWFL